MIEIVCSPDDISCTVEDTFAGPCITFKPCGWRELPPEGYRGGILRPLRSLDGPAAGGAGGQGAVIPMKETLAQIQAEGPKPFTAGIVLWDDK